MPGPFLNFYFFPVLFQLVHNFNSKGLALQGHMKQNKSSKKKCGHLFSLTLNQEEMHLFILVTECLWADLLIDCFCQGSRNTTNNLVSRGLSPAACQIVRMTGWHKFRHCNDHNFSVSSGKWKGYFLFSAVLPICVHYLISVIPNTFFVALFCTLI